VIDWVRGAAPEQAATSIPSAATKTLILRISHPSAVRQRNTNLGFCMQEFP
jgi:hypothetical protein